MICTEWVGLGSSHSCPSVTAPGKPVQLTCRPLPPASCPRHSCGHAPVAPGCQEAAPSNTLSQEPDDASGDEHGTFMTAAMASAQSLNLVAPGDAYTGEGHCLCVVSCFCIPVLLSTVTGSCPDCVLSGKHVEVAVAATDGGVSHTPGLTCWAQTCTCIPPALPAAHRRSGFSLVRYSCRCTTWHCAHVPDLPVAGCRRITLPGYQLGTRQPCRRAGAGCRSRYCG
jgi:hypothetical protein